VIWFAMLCALDGRILCNAAELLAGLLGSGGGCWRGFCCDNLDWGGFAIIRACGFPFANSRVLTVPWIRQ
jgi:hypothetical protein